MFIKLHLYFFLIGQFFLSHMENFDSTVESKHIVPGIERTCQTDVHFLFRNIQLIQSEITRITSIIIICLMSAYGGWRCLTSGIWRGASHGPQ